MGKVEVVPHDPQWRSQFEYEAAKIGAALDKNVVAIHHIGSTSIPNIHAKPVLDLLIEVKDTADLDTQGSAMEALDYEVMGEFGIPGRRYFRKDNADGKRTHQIHAFEAGSPHIERHLAFRDYLISHPKEAQEYSDLKRRLAEMHPNDMDAYIDGKDGFIKAIDLRAEAWRFSMPVIDDNA